MRALRPMSFKGAGMYRAYGLDVMLEDCLMERI